ncbi:MAG: hypothetical protein AB7Q42_21815 [Acidimicrobiia bacterium]
MVRKQSRSRQAAQPARSDQHGVEVNVVVDPTADGGVDGIVRRLRRAGLSVADVLEAVGIVSGHVSQPHLASLANVRGVVAVEQSRDVGVMTSPDGAPQ